MSWFKDLMNKGVKEDPVPVKKKKSPSPISSHKTIEPSDKVTVDLINSEHLFYDLLFGKEADTLEIENSLEFKIVESVGNLLINSNDMTLEPFPKVLREALQKIDSGASLEQVEVCLKQDPIMALQVVKLANTAAFKRSTKEVNSLKMAMSFVGMDSLKQIVTAASIGGMMMKVSPIYFKLFGEKVWQHSLMTAKFCEAAAKEQGIDPYAAFFVGLIHDVGKIAVFKTLVEAIQQSIPVFNLGLFTFEK